MTFRMLTIVVLSACSQGADRSPPARDVGLPPVPPPPAEVEFQPPAAAHLPATEAVFVTPEGCRRLGPGLDGGAPLPWVGVWLCPQKQEPSVLGIWRPNKELPGGVYEFGGLEWVDTWSKATEGWRLTRTVGHRHGQP